MDALLFHDIPIELCTVISSHLEYFDFMNFVELVNINYVQAFIINFKEYYNKSLNHDNIKIIYIDLLLILSEYNLHLFNIKHCVSKAIHTQHLHKHVEHSLDMMEFFNLNLRDDPYEIKEYSEQTVIYLMENEYIDINISVIAILDNLNLFKRFNAEIDISSYREFISNNSYKILEFILTDDIKRTSWLKHDDIDDSDMSRIAEDMEASYCTFNIDIKITKLIYKYIRFTNVEYKSILSNMRDGNIESYRYLVSKIADMEGYFIHEILEDIIQFNSFDMFQLIYNKFSNKLTGDDISSFYFNLLQSNILGLSNNKIKIFKLLSSHSAVKNKFKSKYKDDEKVVDVLDELHTLYNKNCLNVFMTYYYKYNNILSSDDITELYEDILRSDRSTLNNGPSSGITEVLESRLTMLTFLSNQIELKGRVI